MQHEPDIFGRRDLEAESASVARARVDYAAGRYWDHAIVSRWLLTWGKPHYKPFKEWLKSSG